MQELYKMKKLIASVAQISCIESEVENNLAHASELVLAAHERKTELLLFPEFMSQGYRLTEEIWNSAEPFDGPTIAELGDDETIGTGQVSLVPDLRRNEKIPKNSRYIYPGPKGREIIKLMEFQGYLKYTFNNRRKSKALSV